MCFFTLCCHSTLNFDEMYSIYILMYTGKSTNMLFHVRLYRLPRQDELVPRKF